jgi:hypothetical protein
VVAEARTYSMVGVLWASASQGATVKELRAAMGMPRERLEVPRERLEAANDYLLETSRWGCLFSATATSSCWSARPRSRPPSSATWATPGRWPVPRTKDPLRWMRRPRIVPFAGCGGESHYFLTRQVAGSSKLLLPPSAWPRWRHRSSAAAWS